MLALPQGLGQLPEKLGHSALQPPTRAFEPTGFCEWGAKPDIAEFRN